MTEIKLGDKVRCIHTGFTGTAIAKTEFINGCIQFMVVPRVKDARKQMAMMPEEIGIDSQSLELVTKKKKRKQKETGGKMNRNCLRRNF